MRKALVITLLLSAILCYHSNVLAINTYKGLNVFTDSPVQFILTDPEGRRTGFDPVTKTSFREIPLSDYAIYHNCDEQTGSTCNPLNTQLNMADQMPGLYTLDVIGTGSGDFIVEVSISDAAGNEIWHSFEGTTTPGVSSRFTFQGELIFFAMFVPNLRITSAANTFEVNGTFTLGPGGAISPATQPVSIEFENSFLVTIPAHSFQETAQGAFIFKGGIKGTNTCTQTDGRGTQCLVHDIEPSENFEASLTLVGGNEYAFRIVGAGRNSLPSANPVKVRLAIGNNGGEASVNAEFAR